MMQLVLELLLLLLQLLVLGIRGPSSQLNLAGNAQQR
jgi:hypothetical protein